MSTTDHPTAGKHRSRVGQVSSIRTVLVATVGVIVALGAAFLPGAPASAAPQLDSGYGITVNGVSDITPRTFDVNISTDLIDDEITHHGNHVRITLPEGYNSNIDYPVLYLLHGGDGGSYLDWTTDGSIEKISAGQPIITVMPDGGKVGWYTDWTNDTAGNSAWQQYHLDQLIPWIDANLPTIDDKNGRAIAGLSMGGFGAIHYAQERPDLFAYAASLSGALDLEDQAVRTTISQETTANDLPVDGPFGFPVIGQDDSWIGNNPLRNATKLADVDVALYAGGGSNLNDIAFPGLTGQLIERFVGSTTDRMHASLDNADIDHFYWMYGTPGQQGDFYCDGGHNFGCWSFALADVLPRMMETLKHP